MSGALEEGRRIRAALALRGKSSADVATDLNISARTLDRTIAGERQAREWELGRLAEILAIPVWFLQRGFEGLPDSHAEEPDLATLLEELRALDRKLDVRITARIEQLEATVRRLAEKWPVER